MRKQLGIYEYDLNDQLGRGAFGKVYKGVNRQNKQPVAIKMIQKSLKDKNLGIYQSQNHIQRVLQQVKIMDRLNSENVVKLLALKETKNNYYLVQQICQQTLKKYLQNNKCKNQADAIKIMTQILKGYYALIVMNIIHRDIKPDNILVKNGVMKFADFGLSRKFYEEELLETCAGTPGYQSPQVTLGNPYTNKSDIYSLGCLFYEILYGVKLMKNLDKVKLLKRMKQIDDIQHFQFPISPKISKKCQSLILSMLRHDQQKRIDWVDLYSHQFFVNKVPDLLKLKANSIKIMHTLYQQVKKCPQNKNLFKIACITSKDRFNFAQYHLLVIKIFLHQIQIPLEDVLFSFNKFRRNKCGEVSYASFLQCLEKYSNIHIKQPKIMVETESKGSESQSILQSQQLCLYSSQPAQIESLGQDNFRQTYIKFLEQIQKKNISNIEKQFQLQDLSSQGLSLQIFTQFIIQNLNLNITKNECELLFQKFDENGDHKLEIHQFSKLVHNDVEFKKEENKQEQFHQSYEI